MNRLGSLQNLKLKIFGRIRPPGLGGRAEEILAKQRQCVFDGVNKDLFGYHSFSMQKDAAEMATLRKTA